MKKLISILLLLLCAVLAHGDSPLCPPSTMAVANDSMTGTVLYKLAALTAAGNAITMTTSQTTGFAGIVVGNAGVTGEACLAASGVWPLTMDGSTTILHYVQISSATAGDGHDTTSATPPTGGGNIIGQVQAASTGGGSISLIALFPPGILAFNPSGAGISGPGTTVINDCVTWGSTVGASVLDPGATACTVVNNTIHGGNTYYSSAYSNGTTSATTITGLTSPTIAANTPVNFVCNGLYSTASVLGPLELAVSTSQTPQSIFYASEIWSNTTANKSLTTTTANTLLVGPTTNTLGASYQWTLSGEIQWNASTAGTFSIQALDGNSPSSTLTIPAGATCAISI